jgi:hypothetical protein
MSIQVPQALRRVEILFLDFDGVLHPLHCPASQHFCHLHQFEATIGKLPNIEIVISSTWRMQRSLTALKGFFSKHVADRIVGMTPLYSTLEDIPDTLVNYQREAECHAWLQQSGKIAMGWVELEDSEWNFRPFNKNVFLVDGTWGLDSQTSRLFTNFLLAPETL